MAMHTCETKYNHPTRKVLRRSVWTTAVDMGRIRSLSPHTGNAIGHKPHRARFTVMLGRTVRRANGADEHPCLREVAVRFRAARNEYSALQHYRKPIGMIRRLREPLSKGQLSRPF